MASESAAPRASRRTGRSSGRSECSGRACRTRVHPSRTCESRRGRAGGGPLLVKRDAHRREAEPVVRRSRDEQGRSIGRHVRIAEFQSAGVNQRQKGGSALWLVLERDACCHTAARREAHDANSVSRHTVLCCVLADIRHRRHSICDRERPSLRHNLIESGWSFCNSRRRSWVASPSVAPVGTSRRTP